MKTRLNPLALVIAIVGLGMGQVLAQNARPIKLRGVEGFTASITLGLGDLSTVRHPYPVLLSIVNESGREFDGYLRIRYVDKPFQPTIDVPITISSSSKKRYRFCLDLTFESVLHFSLVSGNTVFWEMPPDTPYSPTTRQTEEGLQIFRVLTVAPGDRLLFGPMTFGGQAVAAPWNTQLPSRLASAICGNAEVFELPERDLPLYAFGAILFGGRAKVTQLNPEQVRALARYVAGGGSIFVSAEHGSFIKRLLSSMPWPVAAKPKTRSDVLTVQRIGNGRLFVYTGFPLPARKEAVRTITAPTLLFDSNLLMDGHNLTEPRQSILLAMDSLPTVDFFETVDPFQQYYEHLYLTSPRGMSSFFAILIVFILYTLATGPATFFFKKNKRRMAIYLGCVIGGFVVLSIVTGVFLRYRKGTASWTTVTELTDDGAIQYIGTSLKSCAGQKHVLTFEGDGVETWRFTRFDYSHNSYYKNYYTDRWSLNVNDALVPAKADGELTVPLAPWGSGATLSRTYLNGFCRADLTVSITGKTSTSKNLGQLDVVATGRLKNTLPMTLRNAELVFQIYTAHNNPNRYAPHTESVINRTAIIKHVVGTLEPGQETPFRQRFIFNAAGRRLRDNRHRMGKVGIAGSAALQFPKIASTERIQVLLVAQVEKPPVTTPGECDFIFTKGTHYIIQRLYLEEQPTSKGMRVDAQKFSAQQPQPTNPTW